MQTELYTFVVVDDEPEIREGIRDHIPWTEYGFRFAGACANGIEALASIERESPDVLLTDINMPFMDGLTLTERVQAVSPATKVLILTGYDDFDYAQRALRLQVYDFILKPVTPAELKAVLAKLRERLDEERGKNRDMERLKRQLAESLPLLRERFLNRLSAGMVGIEEAAERSAFFGLDLPIADCCYHLSALDFDRRESGEEFDLALIAERNLIEETEEAYHPVLAYHDEEERALILSWHKSADQLLRDALKYAETLRTRFAAAGMGTISIGLGAVVTGLENLAFSRDGALRALAFGLIRGGNVVMTSRELTGPRPPAEIWGKELLRALKTASVAETDALIDRMVDALRKSVEAPDDFYRALTLTLAAIVGYMEESGIREDEVFEKGADPFRAVRELRGPTQTREWFQTLCARVLTVLRSRQENFAAAKAREAADYIIERFADPDLSIPSLCKDLYISTSYFSLIFKKYRERTFVDFVTEVRIEKAKELLRTTAMKTYEIAERVGYRDAHYFSLSFRKETGMTATEYRNGGLDAAT